jgi:hypothetical protein
MVDFVVWGSRPTGYVDVETAHWLGRTLVGSRGPTRTGLLIAREIPLGFLSTGDPIWQDIAA